MCPFSWINIRIKNAYILLILFGLVLFSCDCEYNYEYIIENKTSSNLMIYCRGRDSTDDEEKTKYISQDTSLIILKAYFFPGGGCPGPDCEDGKYLIDSINIFMNDSLKTILDYKDYKNWTFTHGKSKGTFKVILFDTDFEKVK